MIMPGVVRRVLQYDGLDKECGYGVAEIWEEELDMCHAADDRDTGMYVPCL